jgi:hypothetical protein
MSAIMTATNALHAAHASAAATIRAAAEGLEHLAATATLPEAVERLARAAESLRRHVASAEALALAHLEAALAQQPAEALPAPDAPAPIAPDYDEPAPSEVPADEPDPIPPQVAARMQPAFPVAEEEAEKETEPLAQPRTPPGGWLECAAPISAAVNEAFTRPVPPSANGRKRKKGGA